MKKKIVVALGGNALGNDVEEQLRLVASAAVSIVDLIETGHSIVLTHGNGPQVGMISKGLNFAYAEGAIGTPMPFAESSSLSEGYIGFHLQNAIKNELRHRKIQKDVATVITQVLVDPKDPGFQNPSKPIGEFLTQEEAQRLGESTGHVFAEDSGRGYRRLIASPQPKDIVELNVISTLMDQGHVVIACGGGGIPVIEAQGKYRGIDAVIDKDSTTKLLAELLDADLMIILTAVDYVAINFNLPNMRQLKGVPVKELEEFVQEGHFAKGSMLPKVQAAIDFVKNKPKRNAIITSLENSARAIRFGEGTIVTA